MQEANLHQTIVKLMYTQDFLFGGYPLIMFMILYPKDKISIRTKANCPLRDRNTNIYNLILE